MVYYPYRGKVVAKYPGCRRCKGKGTFWEHVYDGCRTDRTEYLCPVCLRKYREEHFVLKKVLTKRYIAEVQDLVNQMTLEVEKEKFSFARTTEIMKQLEEVTGKLKKNFMVRYY